jgi:hypothetical protein
MPRKLRFMDKTNLPKVKRPLAGRWIDVFKAGTNTDSKGTVSTFTRADLDEIVANHALGAAPAVLGHPKDNDPAFAWTEDVKREGDLLFVKFKDVNPAFDAGVENGAYRNRSVRLSRDPVHGLRLRHVGWLGAMPPAIDGLSTNFSDDGDYMEFAAPYASRTAWALDSIGSMFRAIREMVIADKGVEEADRVLPNYQIDSVESAVADLRNEAEANSNSNFSHGDENMITQEQHDAAVAKAKKEATDEATRNFTAQVNESQKRADKVEAERREERISAQIEGWKKEGKVLPSEVAGLSEFMTNLETAPQTFEFAAADGVTVKKTASDWFVDFMKAQPKKIALGDKTGHEADNNSDQSATQLSVKIQEYMNAQEAKGITVSYAEAMQVVGK